MRVLGPVHQFWVDENKTFGLIGGITALPEGTKPEN